MRVGTNLIQEKRSTDLFFLYVIFQNSRFYHIYNKKIIFFERSVSHAKSIHIEKL